MPVLEEALLKNILTCSRKRGSVIVPGAACWVANARSAKEKVITSFKLTGAGDEGRYSETVDFGKHSLVLTIQN
jgi:hypothetical protein